MNCTGFGNPWDADPKSRAALSIFPRDGYQADSRLRDSLTW